MDTKASSKNQELSNKQYKISVVIPCYNQEKYIENCLKSLSKQKFEGLEIIFVDDGSTDFTKQKIDDYKNKHEELDIYYYYQENAGPGVARNTGIKNAHGKYIAFFDSDDSLPAGAYNALYYTAEKYESDVVIGEYFKRVDNDPWYVVDYIKNYCKEKEGINCVGDYNIALKHPSLWNRLFNREFLNKNKIEFLPEIHGEDLVFNLDTVKYAKNIYTTQSLVYCYTKRASAKDSISTNWNFRNASSHLRSLKSYATYFDKIGDPYTEIMFFSTHFTYFLHGLNSITDSDLQHQLFEIFKELLVLYKNNIKYKTHLDSMLGVPLDIALELPYRAYRAVFFKIKENSKTATNTVTKYISNGSKDQTLQDFKNGQIGFKYIWLYFKAWLRFKLKRKNNKDIKK